MKRRNHDSKHTYRVRVPGVRDGELRRELPERLHLAHSAGGVHRMAAVALSEVRGADPLVSEHPDPELDRPAGAVRELCQNGRNGILCEPQNTKQIAEAMVTLLTDEELRAKYSKGSLEVSALHDLNRTLSRFEEIYQEAIDLKNQQLE